jgi:hypothetical protein
MMKKQSIILKKGGKVTNDAIRKVEKLVGTKKRISKEKVVAKLPDHHFKAVKVKRGMAGLGLFAQEPIKKGELIIEYIGNILTKEEVDAIVINQYLFEITRNKTIDGSVRWNIARYCNHACEEAANAESVVTKGRVFVKAIKDIKEGEEILYDYGEEFVNEYIAPHGCNCLAKEHSYKAALSK